MGCSPWGHKESGTTVTLTLDVIYLEIESALTDKGLVLQVLPWRSSG